MAKIRQVKIFHGNLLIDVQNEVNEWLSYVNHKIISATLQVIGSIYYIFITYNKEI